MELTIHRGSREVGGNCIELRSGETRIILDVGMPLFDENRQPLNTFTLQRQTTEELQRQGILPQVDGLFDDGSAPDAILLSHAHMDHTGLLKHSKDTIPIYASSGSSKMMLAGSLFAGQVELPRERFREIKPESPITIGDFTITGYSVDHSIFGCLAFLIEANGKRLLYTGDLRSHGRKPGMGKRLIEVLKNKTPDAMLMEGTHFGFSDGNLATEYKLEDEITELVKNCESLVLASFSPQHIDRLTCFIRATKNSGRTFVADVYTAFIMHLLKNEISLPQPKPKGLVRVYVPHFLKVSIHNKGRTAQIERFREAEIQLKEIRDAPEKFLMVFRASMLDDFDRLFPDLTACLYSRWYGYLEQPDWKSTQHILAKSNGSLHNVHTSGHMLSKDIVSFVKEIDPKIIIPIHTFEPQEFGNHFSNVKQLKDGEPYQVK
ncbi:MBL fold metallo-hydrolase [Rubinisphaera italica]|uniref:Beta-lactamase superfamily domain protein n=1 Tax=Rubinisphaera italica TaxID=2527969 RepID=A0A5C5XCP6_9PLAN|nr:MBL fold metallo-hydrolase [Rubinisphaera italica]TWT60836.1 Beta-lactamase superfamily domain protein [Rubinisphaera italica]